MLLLVSQEEGLIDCHWNVWQSAGDALAGGAVEAEEHRP